MFLGPGSRGPSVPGLRVPGSQGRGVSGSRGTRVPGLRVSGSQGPGSQVLILDFAILRRFVVAKFADIINRKIGIIFIKITF